MEKCHRSRLDGGFRPSPTHRTCRRSLNRSRAIGAVVRIESASGKQWNMVRSGSSYLSQSELPVTFGVGNRDRIERVQIEWPSGRKEEYKDLAVAKAYEVTEGKGLNALTGF